jgi:hypothetical protein
MSTHRKNVIDLVINSPIHAINELHINEDVVHIGTKYSQILESPRTTYEMNTTITISPTTFSKSECTTSEEIGNCSLATHNRR